MSYLASAFFQNVLTASNLTTGHAKNSCGTGRVRLS